MAAEAEAPSWYYLTAKDPNYPGWTLVKDQNNTIIAGYTVQVRTDTSHIVMGEAGLVYPTDYQPVVLDPQGILTVSYAPMTKLGYTGTTIANVTINR
jgi:hypothetical protein